MSTLDFSLRWIGAYAGLRLGQFGGKAFVRRWISPWIWRRYGPDLS